MTNMLQSAKFEKAIARKIEETGQGGRLSSRTLLWIYPQHQQAPGKQDLSRADVKGFGPDVSGEHDPWPWRSGPALQNPPCQRQPTQYRTMRSASSDCAMPAFGKVNG